MTTTIGACAAYTLPCTALARVAYHGGLPFAAPLACDVADAAGVLHRAEYVPGSMLDYGAARYVVCGVECQLGPGGVLRPVANEERRAA